MRSRFLPIVAVLLAGAAILSVLSCRSTLDLALDDPAFREDMVQAALEGRRFRINPEDYGDILDLYRDEAPDHRRAALILAAQTGDAGFHRLIAMAALDGDAAVKETALGIIAGDAEFYRPAVLALLDEEDPELRIGALEILAEIGGEDLVPLVISFFNDPDPGVRNRASLTVRTLADRMNPFLRDALVDSDPLTVAMAYRTLGRYGHPDETPVFLSAFDSDDTALRREAQLAMLRLGGAGLPALHAEAAGADRSYRTRLSALEVIQGLRSTDSLEVLMELLSDPDPRITLKARSILGTYGAEAVPSLSGLYRESDTDRRIVAVRLMGEIGAPSALPVLAEALDDPSPEVRDTAVASLERFGADAWPALRDRIATGGARSRSIALSLLMAGGDPWLTETGDGEANVTALMMLIVSRDRPDLEDYLNAAGTARLTAETVLSLKDAWDVAGDFSELEKGIEEGGDPYLNAWRQRELYAVASREALQRSFEELHEYFVTGDPANLAAARNIRAESRELEAEAVKWKETAEGMDDEIRARGEERLARYRETRDFLVRTWEYVIPRLVPLAEAVYADRGLDPRALSRESALLE